MKAILLINVSKLPDTLDHRTQNVLSVSLFFCAVIEPVKRSTKHLHIYSNVLTKSNIGITGCDVCKMAWSARNKDPITMLEEFFFPTIVLVHSFPMECHICRIFLQ